MATKRIMIRNEKHDDASSTKRIKTCDNGGVARWSDLDHDVLFLVMMRLKFHDIVAFSGVCKSWRSLALPNRNKFMASKPPMRMAIFTCADEVRCFLKDFKGEKVNFGIPFSCGGDTFVGITCGYFILFRTKTCEFLLVNNVNGHVIHFPPLTGVCISDATTTGILVFSSSISRWVFVILDYCSFQIWYCIAGKGAWNHVSSALPIQDLHFFKGKIYTIDKDCHVYELILNPKPELRLLEIKRFRKKGFTFPEFVSSDEKLYLMETLLACPHIVCELDIGEMKWVSYQKQTKKDEYAFFPCTYKHVASVKPDSWAKVDSWSHKLKKYGNQRFFDTKMWYFPHECFKVNILNE